MWFKPDAVSFGKKCKGLRSFLALTTLLAPVWALAQDAPQMNLQRTKLSAGMYVIDAQVAQTPEQRQTGLMLRKD
ncbi:MAG: DUF192 domain-containing protein, partial [Polaromonas sp.]